MQQQVLRNAQICIRLNVDSAAQFHSRRKKFIGPPTIFDLGGKWVWLLQGSRLSGDVVLLNQRRSKEKIMKAQIPMTSLTALSAALLFAGCCGPKHDRTASYHRRGATTTAYASDTINPGTSSSSRTYVREPESTTASATTTNALAGQNDYSLPLYSESLRVGKREVENGSVRLRKTIKTESASQPIELRRETVTIDREAFENAQNAANAGQGNDIGAAFQEKEIVIDLKREEPVVEVQPYVSGRIVAQKRATTERQNVDRQVRREVVEVIKQGESKDIVVSERVAQDTATGAPARENDRQTGVNTSTNSLPR
jgi:uncharacterized protein (TIGR02271 family)